MYRPASEETQPLHMSKRYNEMITEPGADGNDFSEIILKKKQARTIASPEQSVSQVGIGAQGSALLQFFQHPVSRSAFLIQNTENYTLNR